MKNGTTYIIIAVALAVSYFLLKKWLRSRVAELYDADVSDYSFINLWKAYKAVKK